MSSYRFQNTWKIPNRVVCGNLRVTSALTSGIILAPGKYGTEEMLDPQSTLTAGIEDPGPNGSLSTSSRIPAASGACSRFRSLIFLSTPGAPTAPAPMGETLTW